MKFLSEEHQTRYQVIVQRSDMHPGDTERKALFFIISGNTELFQRLERIYDF